MNTSMPTIVINPRPVIQFRRGKRIHTSKKSVLIEAGNMVYKYCIDRNHNTSQEVRAQQEYAKYLPEQQCWQTQCQRCIVMRKHTPIEQVNLNKLGPTLEKQLLKLTEELFLNIQALHEQTKIAHRDIKPSNIAMTANGKICLLDFELAEKIDGNLSDRRPPVVIGSLKYLSPKLIASAININSINSTTIIKKNDIFAAIITLCTFIQKKYKNDNNREKLYKLLLQITGETNSDDFLSKAWSSTKHNLRNKSFDMLYKNHQAQTKTQLETYNYLSKINYDTPSLDTILDNIKQMKECLESTKRPLTPGYPRAEIYSKRRKTQFNM